MVGAPDSSKAIAALGPRFTSWISSVETATSATRAARRRGVEMTRTSPWASPAASSPLATRPPKLAGSVHERRGGHLLGADLKQEVESLCHLGHLPLLGAVIGLASHLREIALAAELGDRTDAQDVVGALGGGDGTARIEQVEAWEHFMTQS